MDSALVMSATSRPPCTGCIATAWAKGWWPTLTSCLMHLTQELEELLQGSLDLVRLPECRNPGLRRPILQEGISA